MSRKNCRMTEEERAAHDRAVRLRKMTDQQLCNYMNEQYSKGVDEGIKLEKAEAKNKPKDDASVISSFISMLEDKVGSGNGIGGGTIYRLKKELSTAVALGKITGGTV